MRPAPDDWRRMGQEDQLAGLAFTWKNYQAYSGNWEHDHCGFCWKKFLDPACVDWMREALADPSKEHAGAGYTNRTTRRSQILARRPQTSILTPRPAAADARV